MLGTDPDGLAGLSLCYRPRAGRFEEDLAAICKHTGADPAALRKLLQEK